MATQSARSIAVPFLANRWPALHITTRVTFSLPLMTHGDVREGEAAQRHCRHNIVLLWAVSRQWHEVLLASHYGEAK